MQIAARSGFSLPTIRRMAANDGDARRVVDTVTKVVEAFERAGIELIGDNAPNGASGRGMRLRHPSQLTMAAGPGAGGISRSATEGSVMADLPDRRGFVGVSTSEFVTILCDG